MSQMFGTPNKMIPHWAAGSPTQSVMGASYHAASQLTVKPRLFQTTLDTLGVQPPITGAIHTDAYRALTSLANRQALNAAMSGEGNPWLDPMCNQCSATVAMAHNL